MATVSMSIPVSFPKIEEEMMGWNYKIGVSWKLLLLQIGCLIPANPDSTFAFTNNI